MLTGHCSADGGEACLESQFQAVLNAIVDEPEDIEGIRVDQSHPHIEQRHLDVIDGQCGAVLDPDHWIRTQPVIRRPKRNKHNRGQGCSKDNKRNKVSGVGFVRRKWVCDGQIHVSRKNAKPQLCSKQRELTNKTANCQGGMSSTFQ